MTALSTYIIVGASIVMWAEFPQETELTAAVTLPQAVAVGPIYFGPNRVVRFHSEAPDESSTDTEVSCA